jgi:methionine-rich copper-binding protein CopC
MNRMARAEGLNQPRQAISAVVGEGPPPPVSAPQNADATEPCLPDDALRPKLRKWMLPSSLAIAVCLIGQMAWAHAFLDHASPAVGSEVSGSPPAVVLTYSEPVEPLFSAIQVTDSNGARVEQGATTAVQDGRVLEVKLKTLAPGIYTVAWHVTSVDTHKTDGHFTFTVKP